jgi:hypothetical protein
MERNKTATVATIDTTNLPYRNLNAQLRDLVTDGTEKIIINNVYGQLYTY